MRAQEGWPLIVAGGAGGQPGPPGPELVGGGVSWQQGMTWEKPRGFDDSDASLLLWVNSASSAPVGDKRGDCHLQCARDANIPKALTSNQVKKSVIEENREQSRGEVQLGSSCRNGLDLGPEKIKK